MEVKQSPAWLDINHPNYIRWKNAREISFERGKFVHSIIKQKLVCKNLKILDLGSGEGGTAKIFSQDNFVVSFDMSLLRLKRQKALVIPKDPDLNRETEESVSYFDDRFLSRSEIGIEMTHKYLVNGNALQLPFSDRSFDLIIIQDVLEHLSDIIQFYTEIKRVLKTNGIIYLSTPNKLSVFNFISDPHFGLPVISTLNRKSIKKYFLKYFRKNDYNRSDIAELLTLKQIINLFNDEFEITINTKFSVQELFNGNKGIVWSDFHLGIIRFCKNIKLDKLLIKIANDKIGFVNNYFTPTFYFTMKFSGISVLE